PEELGGARMHSEISGTVDFLEKDDRSCLMRIRSLIDILPEDLKYQKSQASFEVEHYPYTIYDIVSGDSNKMYDTRDLLSCIIDRGSLQEFKKDYGPTLVTAFAKIN